MNPDIARHNLIEQQIKPANVLNEQVLNAIASLKRESFVPCQYANLAFADLMVPLDKQQTMFTPIQEAKLLQALNVLPTDIVLEIGTGSAYLTGLLAKLAHFVYSVEIDEDIYNNAKNTLSANGINNVKLINANGLAIELNEAPFNKILIGGGLRSIPNTLKRQLILGGKLVAIVGERPTMQAVMLEKLVYRNSAKTSDVSSNNDKNTDKISRTTDDKNSHSDDFSNIEDFRQTQLFETDIAYLLQGTAEQFVL